METQTTSNEATRSNTRPRLAAAEETALASQHMNGVYNESGGDAIPSSDQSLWKVIRAEWRVIGMVLSPFALALAVYFVPATQGGLDGVRTEAAAKLELTKTDIGGQLNQVKTELNGQIAVITTRINGLQETLTHTQSGVDELLRRSAPPPRQYDSPQIAASSSAPPQDNPPQEARRATKKKPIAAKPQPQPQPTGFLFFR